VAVQRSALIFDHAGKNRATVIAADVQVVRAEGNFPIAFQRAHRNAGILVRADVEKTVAKHLDGTGAAASTDVDPNLTAQPAVEAAISDEGRITCGGLALDKCQATA